MQSCLQLLDLVVQDFSLATFCHRLCYQNFKISTCPNFVTDYVINSRISACPNFVTDYGINSRISVCHNFVTDYVINSKISACQHFVTDYITISRISVCQHFVTDYITNSRISVCRNFVTDWCYQLQTFWNSLNVAAIIILLKDTDNNYFRYIQHIFWSFWHFWYCCCAINLERGNSAKSGDEGEIVAMDVRGVLRGAQVGGVGQGGQVGGGVAAARWDQTRRCSSRGTHQ